MKVLKDFRELMKKTPEEMAKELKISLSYYEKVEYGYIKPSRNFIDKFAKKFPMIDTNIFFTK